MRDKPSAQDQATANAFAHSWNNLPRKPIYSPEQHADWLAPLGPKDFEGKDVLELGCGNGSLLFYGGNWNPRTLIGVDLGDSVRSAEEIMAQGMFKSWKIIQADLTEFRAEPFDIVYCIGVLHHLKQPESGLDAVLRNVKPGGAFHCWVYAKEGNRVVRSLVEPLRHVVSRWPWPVVKYGIAMPLAMPFFAYAKGVSMLKDIPGVSRLPLFSYCQWAARREFAFFRHVAFDQLVTPQTTFFDKQTIEDWLAARPEVEPQSIYIQFRNGNSWKFGGRVKESPRL
jgi:SAM-dependent methyltransferase